MTGIVLDTCVLSEMRRPAPAEAVVGWFVRQEAEQLHFTTTTLGEIYAGIDRLGAGRRRSQLETILPAACFASDRKRPESMVGCMLARPPAGGGQTADTQIAAVAAVHGMTVATRNLGDFAPFGVPLVDPWTA